jgi:hypothetical protein
MRTRLRFTLWTLLVTTAAYAQSSGVERRQDLGFGFHRDIIAQDASWELGHFEYLFYGSRKLSQIDECAVAPSGKAVVYQDAPSGKIFLFRPADSTVLQLSDFPGLVQKFDWHESEGFISAVVADQKEKTSAIKLQLPKT